MFNGKDIVEMPQNSTFQNVSLPICRICHGGENSNPFNTAASREPLISPCFCKGSMGLYHPSCLERWLITSNRAYCEICHFKYKLERMYPTFNDFLASKQCSVERRNLVTDVTCFVFLTPVAITCIVMCIVASMTMTRTFTYWSSVNAAQAVCLLMLSVILSITYSVWFIVAATFHLRTFREWQTENECISVIDPDARQKNGRRRTLNGTKKSLALKALLIEVGTHIKSLFCFEFQHSRDSYEFHSSDSSRVYYLQISPFLAQDCCEPIRSNPILLKQNNGVQPAGPSVSGML